MRLFCYLFILFLSLLTTSSYAKNSLLIENINIISPQFQQPQLNRNVLIEDGRITKISDQKISSKGLKIDGNGMFLTPGLMDSHAHVSSIPGMGFGVEPVSQKHPKLVSQYYEQQPRSFLYYGVTQVLDPNPGINSHHFTQQELHPKYFRCEVITSNNTFPYVEKQDDVSRSMFPYLIDENAKKNELNSAEDIVHKISKSGASCIKLYFENGYGNADHWKLLSKKTLSRIKNAAKEMQLPILAHANAFDMQKLAVEADVDIIAHGLWNWGEFSRSQTIPKQISDHLDIIISKKIGFMPTQRVITGLGEVMIPKIEDTPEFKNVTPDSLIQWYKTSDAEWFKGELRYGFDGLPDETIVNIFKYGRIGKGGLVIDYLNKLNHPILLASDFPGSPTHANQPGLTTFLEMKAMINAGLNLHEVLAAATINNAKQFNIDDDYGSVEVGKMANLLLLKNNPLESIEAWDSINTVILNGKPIAREDLSSN